MYHRVVVPLDGSELAESVLSHVAEMIRGRGSQVYLLSITPMMKAVTPPFLDLRLRGEERHPVEGELRQYLQAVARQLDQVATDVQINVRSGRPADEILTFVDEVGADLVAMSAHGRSGIGRWVFGSVTDRVLHATRCPVLVVRKPHPQGQSAYRRIVVPLDGSELAEQVLPYIQALVRVPPSSSLATGVLEGAHVFLVSVLATGLSERTVALLTSYPPGLQLAATALDHAEVQLRSYLRSVAAVLRKLGIATQIAVRRGAPADEILAYTAEVGADLIGMSTHGLSGNGRWVYGNVAGKVLQGALSPVLLVRPTSGQGGDGV